MTVSLQATQLTFKHLQRLTAECNPSQLASITLTADRRQHWLLLLRPWSPNEASPTEDDSFFSPYIRDVQKALSLQTSSGFSVGDGEFSLVGLCRFPTQGDTRQHQGFDASATAF